MFLKHLHEQFFNEIKSKQAIIESEISTDKAIFDKEWKKWTTPRKIKKNQPSK